MYLPVVLQHCCEDKLNWSVWVMCTCATLEFEYLRLAINGAFFSHQRTILLCEFIPTRSWICAVIRTSSSSCRLVKGRWMCVRTGFWPFCFICSSILCSGRVRHSLARCLLRTVPVMFPDGLSRGRRTCVGKKVKVTISIHLPDRLWEVNLLHLCCPGPFSTCLWWCNVGWAWQSRFHPPET